MYIWGMYITQLYMGDYDKVTMEQKSIIRS